MRMHKVDHLKSGASMHVRQSTKRSSYRLSGSVVRLLSRTEMASEYGYGALFEEQVPIPAMVDFGVFSLMLTDGPTDGRTDGQTLM